MKPQCLLLVILLVLPTRASSCVTRWFDRDDPSGVGDFETTVDLRKEYPGQICSNPIEIEAQTVDRIPAGNTGQIFNPFNAAEGFACVNAAQKTGSCRDYRVRFTCPPEFCSGCTTRWFDRDDPSGKGDYELTADLRKEYPNGICAEPVAISVQTLDGTPASQTGQTFAVFDATEGFACVNQDQVSEGKSCRDYKVRFSCPKSFC